MSLRRERSGKPKARRLPPPPPPPADNNGTSSSLLGRLATLSALLRTELSRRSSANIRIKIVQKQLPLAAE